LLVIKASGVQDAMHQSEKGNGTWKFALSTEVGPVIMSMVTLGGKAVTSDLVGHDERHL
jgi:hypothetical protein